MFHLLTVHLFCLPTTCFKYLSSLVLPPDNVFQVLKFTCSASRQRVSSTYSSLVLPPNNVFRVLSRSLVLLPDHVFCILTVHLVCLLISGLVGAQTGHSDVITCLEARYKCRHDDTCSSLLEKMTRTCDRSSTYDRSCQRLP